MFEKTRTIALTAASTLLIAVLAACGSSEETATGEGASAESTTSTTVVHRADETRAGLVGCLQMGMGTDVDPAVAAPYLLADQALFVNDEGSGRFTLIVKECDDLVVDGESHGSGHFNTAWIRIEGPEETRALEERPDLTSRPTDCFQPVLFQTDNADFASALQAFGMPLTLADSITFEPPGSGAQSGSATDTEIEPSLAYEWNVTNGFEFPPGDSGVVHVLQGEDDRSESLTYDIECVINGGFGANSGRVDIEPGSHLEDLLGEGYDSLGAAPGLTCRVDIVRGDAG